MPTVSIIMGVYNCKNKHLLEASVQSIIDQTYKDWEFIICNDGSTDDTLAVLNKLALQDKRIKIVTYNVNRGLSEALNTAMSKASGKYIARQDDDDVSYPSRIEEEIQFITAHPKYQIVGCIADVYDDNGIWGQFPLKEKPEAKDFMSHSQFLHPSVIMLKDAVDNVGGYRTAWETRKAEDYDLFMRMYAQGYRGYNIQSKLYKYRVVNGNTKYRKFKDYSQETIVRYLGFKALGLGLISIPYVIKPLIVGIIPQSIFKHIKKKQYDNYQREEI